MAIKQEIIITGKDLKEVIVLGLAKKGIIGNTYPVSVEMFKTDDGVMGEKGNIIFGAKILIHKDKK